MAAAQRVSGCGAEASTPLRSSLLPLPQQDPARAVPHTYHADRVALDRFSAREERRVRGLEVFIDADPTTPVPVADQTPPTDSEEVIRRIAKNTHSDISTGIIWNLATIAIAPRPIIGLSIDNRVPGDGYSVASTIAAPYRSEATARCGWDG